MNNDIRYKIVVDTSNLGPSLSKADKMLINFGRRVKKLYSEMSAVQSPPTVNLPRGSAVGSGPNQAGRSASGRGRTGPKRDPLISYIPPSSFSSSFASFLGNQRGARFGPKGGDRGYTPTRKPTYAAAKVLRQRAEYREQRRQERHERWRRNFEEGLMRNRPRKSVREKIAEAWRRRRRAGDPSGVGDGRAAPRKRRGFGLRGELSGDAMPLFQAIDRVLDRVNRNDRPEKRRFQALSRIEGTKENLYMKRLRQGKLRDAAGNPLDEVGDYFRMSNRERRKVFGRNATYEDAIRQSEIRYNQGELGKLTSQARKLDDERGTLVKSLERLSSEIKENPRKLRKTLEDASRIYKKQEEQISERQNAAKQKRLADFAAKREALRSGFAELVGRTNRTLSSKMRILEERKRREIENYQVSGANSLAEFKRSEQARVQDFKDARMERIRLYQEERGKRRDAYHALSELRRKKLKEHLSEEKLATNAKHMGMTPEEYKREVRDSYAKAVREAAHEYRKQEEEFRQQAKQREHEYAKEFNKARNERIKQFKKQREAEKRKLAETVQQIKQDKAVSREAARASIQQARERYKRNVAQFTDQFRKREHEIDLNERVGRRKRAEERDRRKEDYLRRFEKSSAEKQAEYRSAKERLRAIDHESKSLESSIKSIRRMIDRTVSEATRRLSGAAGANRGGGGGGGRGGGGGGAGGRGGGGGGGRGFPQDDLMYGRPRRSFMGRPVRRSVLSPFRGGFVRAAGRRLSYAPINFTLDTLPYMIRNQIESGFADGLEVEKLEAQIRRYSGLEGDDNGEIAKQIAKSMREYTTTAPGFNIIDALKIAEMGGRYGIGHEAQQKALKAGMDVIESAKVGAKALTDYAKAMMKIQVALDDVSVEIASAKMASIMENFDIAADKVLGVGSIMNKVSATTRMTGEQILDVTERLSLLGKQSGFTLEQTAALATAVGVAGLRNEMGSNNMMQFVMSMFDKNKAGQFGDLLGVSPQDYGNLISNKPFETMMRIIEELKKMEGGRFDVTGFMRELGYTGVRVNTVASALMEQFAQIPTYLEMAKLEMATSKSIADEIAIVAGLTGSQLELLKSKIIDMRAVLFEALSPAIKDSMVNIGLLAERLKQLKDSKFFDDIKNMMVTGTDLISGIAQDGSKDDIWNLLWYGLGGIFKYFFGQLKILFAPAIADFKKGFAEVIYQLSLLNFSGQAKMKRDLAVAAANEWEQRTLASGKTLLEDSFKGLIDYARPFVMRGAVLRGKEMIRQNSVIELDKLEAKKRMSIFDPTKSQFTQEDEARLKLLQNMVNGKTEEVLVNIADKVAKHFNIAPFLTKEQTKEIERKAKEEKQARKEAYERQEQAIMEKKRQSLISIQERYRQGKIDDDTKFRLINKLNDSAREAIAKVLEEYKRKEAEAENEVRNRIMNKIPLSSDPVPNQTRDDDELRRMREDKAAKDAMEAQSKNKESIAFKKADNLGDLYNKYLSDTAKMAIAQNKLHNMGINVAKVDVEGGLQRLLMTRNFTPEEAQIAAGRIVNQASADLSAMINEANSAAADNMMSLIGIVQQMQRDIMATRQAYMQQQMALNHLMRMNAMSRKMIGNNRQSLLTVPFIPATN